jgi:hypothetical protein
LDIKIFLDMHLGMLNKEGFFNQFRQGIIGEKYENG